MQPAACTEEGAGERGSDQCAARCELRGQTGTPCSLRQARGRGQGSDAGSEVCVVGDQAQERRPETDTLKKGREWPAVASGPCIATPTRIGIATAQRSGAHLRVRSSAAAPRAPAQPAPGQPPRRQAMLAQQQAAPRHLAPPTAAACPPAAPPRPPAARAAANRRLQAGRQRTQGAGTRAKGPQLAWWPAGPAGGAAPPAPTAARAAPATGAGAAPAPGGQPAGPAAVPAVLPAAPAAGRKSR